MASGNPFGASQQAHNAVCRKLERFNLPCQSHKYGSFGVFGKVTGFTVLYSNGEKPKSDEKAGLLAVLPCVRSRDTIPT